MFIGAGAFLPLVNMYRLVWLSGRFGGGKTLMAFAIAQQYLERGYRLVTNARTVWADAPDSVRLDVHGHLRAVVLLDEGGIYLKASVQVEQMCAYAAKMDVVYLIPSYWPPVRAAQVVTVQPVWSLLYVGIPVTFYKWQVRQGAMRDSGWFAFALPSKLYGVYSRNDPGADANVVVQWAVTRMQEFRRRWGHADFHSLSVQSHDYISDAASDMIDAADSMAEVAGRLRRKRWGKI